jgi:hypothetical protein
MSQDARFPRRSPRATAYLPAAHSIRWTLVPFRIVITAAAVLLFDQAIFAGQFLAGTFGSLQTHRENATVAGLTVLAAAVAAVPVRWPGKGPIWPVFACLGLFGLIALQIALGFARVLAVHIPLGVAIILLAILLVVRAWRLNLPPVDPRASQGSHGDVPAAGRESGP